MAVHQGSCHCGAVKFEVEGLDLDKLMTCNCSICGRSGSIMAFVGANQFTQTAGKDNLTDYQFGKKVIHHVFCTTCGVRPFASGKGEDGAEWMMINARCLEGVDVHKLTISQQYDGQSL